MNKKLFLSIVFVFLLSITNAFSQDGNSENEEKSDKEENNSHETSPYSDCNTGFKTYSIGGWGASCNSGKENGGDNENSEGNKNDGGNSNNAACYRNANFENAFPNDLTIGCNTYKLKLTSAAAVEAFLPSGSTAKVLSGNLNDPGNDYKNVLAAQLVALTLSVRFDEYDSNFASNSGNLSSLIIADGPFKDVSVESFLQIANDVIGGCSTAYSLSDVLTTAEAINLNYDKSVDINSNSDNGDSENNSSENNSSENGDSENGDSNNENGYLICKSNSANRFAIKNPITNENTVTIDNHVKCYDNKDGKVTVTVINGVAPYEYTLNSGATSSGSINNTSYQFSGLGAGNYTVTVKDGNNNTATSDFTITQPANALTATATATAVLCKGGNGSVDLNVSGGTSPYTYSWTNEETTEDLAAVLAGNYTVTITDANGCTTTASATVSEPNAALTATATATAVLCKGGNGFVDLNVSGGTSPYSYSWTNEEITEDLAAVLAGNYTVTITDANGCTTTASATITEPDYDLTANVDSQTNVSCNGGSDGSVVITPAGGTGEYKITPAQTGLKAGTYTFTVKDANLCSVDVNVTIEEPTELSATFEQKNVLCNGESNGTATVTATGGTGSYSYSWNTTPAQTTATATGLSAGTYEVTITDANSCSKTFSVTITQPEVLSVSISKTDLICSYDLGTATANVTGGTAPFTYVWKSIEKEHDEDDDHDEDDHDEDDHDEDDHESTPNQTTQTASFKTGTWAVTVTDFNGCTATNNVTIILLSFTTVTPAGYSGKSEGNKSEGNKSEGNNWGKNYLVANFASKFPNGLTIGGAKTVKFNTAAAIQAFLPSGGAAKALTGNLTNPTSKSFSNALASQTVALTLTLAFDADSNFSTSIISLGSRVIRSGIFAGKTVNELLALANTVLGGGSSSYKPAQISEALDAINKSYANNNEKHDNEESSKSGYLTSLCPSSNKEKSSESDKNGESELSCLEKSFVLYPNPANDKSNLDFTLKNDSTIKIELYNKYGQYISKIYDGVAKAGKANSVNINAASLNPDTYLMLIYTNKGVITKRIAVTK